MSGEGAWGAWNVPTRARAGAKRGETGRLRPGYSSCVSTADGWGLTVPEDEVELLAELRRHGVRPGQRLHVLPAASQPEDAPKPQPPAPGQIRHLSFAGLIHAEADLSENTVSLGVAREGWSGRVGAGSGGDSREHWPPAGVPCV